MFAHTLREMKVAHELSITVDGGGTVRSYHIAMLVMRKGAISVVGRILLRCWIKWTLRMLIQKALLNVKAEVVFIAVWRRIPAEINSLLASGGPVGISGLVAALVVEIPKHAVAWKVAHPPHQTHICNGHIVGIVRRDLRAIALLSPLPRSPSTYEALPTEKGAGRARMGNAWPLPTPTSGSLSLRSSSESIPSLSEPSLSVPSSLSASSSLSSGGDG